METRLKINVEDYLEQFNVIGQNKDLHCENLSQILYGAILNKFKVTMSEDEYFYFKEYQERVFDLVENMRELHRDTIAQVFDFLAKVNYYLIDIIITLWCLPRSDNFLSKKIYDKKYKENIKKYNEKMVKNICHIGMKNFCIETITKTNNVPVHCIDYIWFYMANLSMDFNFYNSNGGGYIGFTMQEHNSDDEFIGFGFNMEYLLNIGLGQVVYPNDSNNKGAFRDFIRNLVINPVVVKKILCTQENFRNQLKNISKDPKKYFGESLKELPKEIMDELKN